MVVPADANLGAAEGGIKFAGGTLTVNGTGYGGTSRVVKIDGGTSRILEITDASHSFTLSGDVGGGGRLTKIGAGTLILSANNTYGGGTFVQVGTLIGTASSIRGNIYNQATFVSTKLPTPLSAATSQHRSVVPLVKW